MRSCRSESTLAELLSDPIVRAVMAADKVVPAELERNLSKIAVAIEPQRRARP